MCHINSILKTLNTIELEILCWFFWYTITLLKVLICTIKVHIAGFLDRKEMAKSNHWKKLLPRSSKANFDVFHHPERSEGWNGIKIGWGRPRQKLCPVIPFDVSLRSRNLAICTFILQISTLDRVIIYQKNQHKISSSMVLRVFRLN